VHKPNQYNNSILVNIAIVLKFIEHHGWLELLHRGWIAAIKWFFLTKSIFIMKLDSEAITEPNSGLVLKELAYSDIDRMLKVMYLSRDGLEKRFESGQRCFAVLDGDQIVTYFWARFRSRKLDDMTFEFAIGPRQVWFYNAVTVKSVRGRGHYPNIIRYMAQTLKSEGFDEFFIDAEQRNHASIRGMEKSGCKNVARISMKKLLWKVKYNVKVFDERCWHGLLQGVSDSGQLQIFSEQSNGN